MDEQYVQKRTFPQRLFAALRAEPDEKPNVLKTLAWLIPLAATAIVVAGYAGEYSAAFLGTKFYTWFGLG